MARLRIMGSRRTPWDGRRAGELRSLVPKLYSGTPLSSQLCCRCCFPATTPKAYRSGIGSGIASAIAFPNRVSERGNLLSGWPKATGGDPDASLDSWLNHGFSGDLLRASRARTTSCPGHRSFRGRYLGFLCAALFLFLAPAASADITGTVTLQGKPNSHDETFVAKANGCGESPIRHTENWKVGPQGELGDVVVWIVDPKFGAFAGELREPAIEQIGCRYVPHIIAVRAGQSFKITNGDPTLHNIRAKVYDGPGQPPGADVFNFGQAVQGQTDDKEFDDPGIYTLQCDVHSWMQCWVMVLPKASLPGAFGVTEVDGTFKLVGGGLLVDGDYKIDAWHPRFAQTLEQTIHVKNGTASVAFQFDGTKSF